MSADTKRQTFRTDAPSFPANLFTSKIPSIISFSPSSSPSHHTARHTGRVSFTPDRFSAPPHAQQRAAWVARHGFSPDSGFSPGKNFKGLIGFDEV